jgi:hypothetical protein
VKELSQKNACSKRTIYNDFEARSTWHAILQGEVKPGAVLLKVVNRYEQIYRQDSMRFRTASNELAKLGALNVMSLITFIVYKLKYR